MSSMKTQVSGSGGTSKSASQNQRFFKVLVNMQWVRDNPPFFSTYYVLGHRKPRVGDKLYIRTENGFVSAGMRVAGFSRGAIAPEPSGE